MDIPVSQFIVWALPHAYRNSDVVQYAGQISKADQWQYILGDYGQDVNGKLTMDCNGLAEAYLNFMIPDTNHNSASRYNYRDWCTEKSSDMSTMPQLPGLAVFAGESAETIHHVGFLVSKWGSGPHDWLVMQEENESLDFRLTKLRVGSSNFSFWGAMKKFFAYDLDAAYDPFKNPIAFNYAACPYPAPVALPESGSQGNPVRWLQWQLIMHDHLIDSSGPLRNGIDGVFGRKTLNALTAYQKDTDVSGDNTIKALLGQAFDHPDSSIPIDIKNVPWLSYGSKGKAVAYMQSQLVRKGEKLPASIRTGGYYGMDGNFGKETTRALRHFQQTHNDIVGHPLHDDGICGPLTWGALLGIRCT